jgi:hypothetical protein
MAQSTQLFGEEGPIAGGESMRYFLMLALLLMATAGGCDGYTTVRGRVVDPTGEPILEAEVKLIYKPDDPRYTRTSTAKTEKEGRYAVGIVHSPSKSLPIRLEVNKKGLTKYAENLTSMASYEKEIVLRPSKE